ncbi:MAG: hypothetical protein LT106_11825 [Burkholderiaceae bacterium]|nr:hypothetical protein [Burkholderiaceae bacterium]
MKRTDELSTPAPAVAATTARRRKSLPSLLTSAAIVLAFVATPAFAVDEHHPEAAAGSTVPSATSTVETGPTIEKMQENVRQMQSQLERAANAKTDDDRRAALLDHMRTMQANMMLGRSMMMGAVGGYPTMDGGVGPGAMGPGMMGPGMMCPGMMGHGMMSPGMMSPGMMGRGHTGGADSPDMQRMERRLDMMQMMMEQMMRSRAEQPGTMPSMPAR